MAEPVLEIRELRKSYGALKATDRVSLTLMPGEIHGLIGPNGAGKSTLIGQIAGQIAPDSGTVHLLGRDVTGLSVAARARLGLGRTFQVTSVCLEFTALQNAVLALIGHRRGAWGFLRPAMTDPRLTGPAMETLAQFDLDDRADTPAGALSHGERRQLELAMAFALEPRCLLLDEPMAGLGAGGVPALSGILERLSARCPMLLIEHDMDAVFRLADRISVLAEGRVIFEGTADEVRASPLVRQTYLGEAA